MLNHPHLPLGYASLDKKETAISFSRASTMMDLVSPEFELERLLRELETGSSAPTTTATADSCVVDWLDVHDFDLSRLDDDDIGSCQSDTALSLPSSPSSSASTTSSSSVPPLRSSHKQPPQHQQHKRRRRKRIRVVTPVRQSERLRIRKILSGPTRFI